ncbi:hypothetical protein [Rhodococcus jostii]|uniref:hypothetical protein n=1 Tax=Rhodococcus jostii TaxID=132919 RepID=UPI00362CF615
MSILSKLVNKLKSLRASEPVRTTVYPILILALAVLVGSGTLSSDTSDLITTITGLVLGVGATEAARSKVTPAGRVAEVADVVTEVVAQVRRAGVSPEVQAILDRARQTVTDTIGRHRSTER